MRATPRRVRAPALPLLVSCATSLAVLSPVPAGVAAQDHDHPPGGVEVGSVSLPVSCAPAVQADFDRAVAMLHSFWFEEAEQAFRGVAEADPGCAMAHWGVAMTLWGNPMARAAPAPERVTAAREAVSRARALTPGSHREQMYVDAVAALYDGSGDHFARMRAHEESMQRLVDMHGDDPEATIFLGRIMVANAPPDDLTFSRQLRAAEMLEPVFQRMPDHPGLAHYIIHAFDAPAIAESGLAAARRYADIAPAAPHALHMPSHIFTRLGLWDESIATNARSAAAEPNPDAAVHPMDYMVYAHLQLGQDVAAEEVVGRARTISDRFYGGTLGYNFAAMHARYALERSRWDEASRVPVPTGALPYVEAIARFTRAVGSARSGDAAAARTELGALGDLGAALRARNDAYWTTIVEAQRLAAASWVAHAEGRDDEAVRLAREAADLEGTVEKHPVTPGPLLPARELLGDMLLELDRPEEALQAYEATLSKEPGRARALAGAARAAEAAGNAAAARTHYTALVDLMSRADTERPELAAARRYLSG